MNCLIIIPDLDSGSGTCTRYIAKELLSRGHSVRLLTRYRHENEAIETIGYMSSQRELPRVLLSIKRVLLYPIWPYLSLKEFLKIFVYSDKIIVSEGVDVVISIYNNVESITAGAVLKKKYPRLLYIPYFLDALFAGPKPRFMPSFLKKRKALWIENKILKYADSVIMMKAVENDYHKNKDKMSYFHKIVFLDLPLYLPRNNTIIQKRNHFPDNQIVLFFAGALPLHIRNPRALLEIVRSCTEKDIHLYIAGSGDYDRMLKEFSDRSERIHLLGTLNYYDVQEMYREADFLVNIGNTLSSMVPSKIFEYMSFGKPIISTTKINNDPCIPYLKKYKNAIIIKENESIDKSVMQLLSFIDMAKPFNQPSNSFKLNQPSTFVNFVSSLYNGDVRMNP